MRELVLDTETTGLDPAAGHRVVEIGVVELRHGMPTGQEFHIYLNPERSVPLEVVRVHGLTEEFLADKPKFAEVANDFLEFIASDRLVIHNANFDLKFLHAELVRLDYPPLANPVTDTIPLARAKFGSAPVNLDALCRRFGVDNSHRDKHGALLDCLLLAKVYNHLLGGPQVVLDLSLASAAADTSSPATRQPKPLRQTLSRPPTAAELTQHEALVAGLKNPIWS
jgi:DNA polymerase-3 subunit epsilon